MHDCICSKTDVGAPQSYAVPINSVSRTFGRAVPFWVSDVMPSIDEDAGFDAAESCCEPVCVLPFCISATVSSNTEYV
jgi:hypothetical protein